MPNVDYPSHAVIMGDLINSRSAPSEALYDGFNQVIDQANLRHADQLASPLTITLGDEFQGLSHDLSSGAEILRDLRGDLLDRNIECRFVLGTVKLDTPLNTTRAWNMMGEGLSQAREILGNKHNPNAYRLHVPEDPLAQTLLNAIGLSLTAIERGWTQRQLEISSLFRRNSGSVSQHAHALQLAPRTVYKIRNAARMDLYDAQWQAVMDALKIIDQRLNLK